jgi:acyl-CoA hydrolase
MPPSETQPSQKLEPGLITEARLIEMVFPEQTNHYGTLFGGQALALMGQLGTRGRFVFVALDAHGRPTAVPPLSTPSPTTKD